MRQGHGETDAAVEVPAEGPGAEPLVRITIDTREAQRSGGRDPIAVQVVQVHGEVDLLTIELLVATLAETLAGAVRLGIPRVVVDIAAMTSCDTRALTVLLHAATLATGLDTAYALTGLSPRLAHLAAMLRPHVPIYPDRASAITAVGLGTPWPASSLPLTTA